ncbi:hypothetical protein B0G69_2152 [Paraburkholderia sp. RAU2J]|uniref:hypothetical protein n=1 Tax=Paraburkholderia sp. RAU2J TaxID=1938810 RepID=UPI000EB5B30B|nr:hypothetical protein [Paraburkholderia sp. RAU2J]RKT26407.1 hypothetical protein B0G69_2152 [Paraburkholderia sp. RAU2J]
MVEDYETTQEIEIEFNGVWFRGRYRVMNGTVIVYFENEIKFASHDMNRPDMVARWLLTDLARRVESRKRKAVSGGHSS